MNRFIAAALLSSALAVCHAQTLRVMTFNVRYPAKSDGINVWENRRDLLVETIRTYKPDLMGTQELFESQGKYIVEKLPEYKWIGVSRRGNQEDEYSAIFYRSARFKLIESGNYWLSETPEQPGSMSWDVTLPRMVTWGVFEDTANGRRFHYSNTHFAHRAQDAQARLESARLIAARLRKLPEPAALLLTGDFNTGAGSPPHTLLTEFLKDAWMNAKERKGPEGTFHGFSGKPGNSRIDWILFRGPLSAVSAEVITHNKEGRYPSDHFPVIAVFEWQ